MRVALVHSRYSSAVPSGENTVVDAEYEALRAAGVDVALFQTEPETLRRRSAYPVAAALRVATGRGPDFADRLRDFAPDVVHVHNAFPDLGERDLARLDFPLVLTAHNYRSFCANGYAFRDGRTCTDCLHRPGRSWNAVVHGCFHGRVASVPLAIRNLGGPANNPLFRAAVSVLIPSEHARQVLVTAGLHAEKAVVSPHFLPRSLEAVTAEQSGDRGPYAFVGRLTAEKGLEALLGHWPADRELAIVGDGDERERLQDAYASANVRFLGQISRQEVVELLAAARALVFSSLWWETFGLVAMEALSAGTPVLSLGRHAVADLVREHAVGCAVDGADDLGAGVAAIEAVPPADWQAKVSAVFETSFSEDVWLRRRLHDYSAVLGVRP
jgi:glycosyltransferase involved in cell wall biosynthesis